MKPFKESHKRKIAVRLVPLNHSPTLPVFGARLFSYRVIGSHSYRNALYTLMSTLRIPTSVEVSVQDSDEGWAAFTLTDWMSGDAPWTARVQADDSDEHLISLWQGRGL